MKRDTWTVLYGVVLTPDEAREPRDTREQA